VQRGPSFPKADIAFDRNTGGYWAVVQEQVMQEQQEGDEKTATGSMEMPGDLYNGMDLVLLKNLPAGTSATVHTAAFLPTRLIKTVLSPEGEGTVRAGAGNPRR
jgi:hypothetical protein